MVKVERLNIFLIAVLFGLLTGTNSLAQSITIQGKVTNASGTPITGSGVQFRVQILSPDSNACVLYDETQTLNLSASEGLFSINLNSGIGTVNAPTTYSLEQSVSNFQGFSVNSTYCPGSAGSGTVVYSPTFDANRKIKIQFEDPGTMSAFEALPVIALNTSAQAIDATRVGGYPASSLLRVLDGVTPGTPSSFTSAQFNSLVQLIAGTSPNYMTTTTGSTTGAQLPTVSGSPSAPSNGSIWYDTSAGSVKYYNGSTTVTLGTSNANGTITAVNTPAGSGLTGGGSTGSVSLSLASSGVTAGTYGSSTTIPSLTVDAFGRVTAASATVISGVSPGGSAGGDLTGSYPSPTVAKIQGIAIGTTAPSSGEFFKYNGTSWAGTVLGLSDIKAGDNSNVVANGSCSANQTMFIDGTGHFNCQGVGSLDASAITAGTFVAGLMPAFTGDATSAAGSTALTLSATGVAANTYKSVTVDAKGRVLAGANPTTLAGFGITDSVQNTGGLPSMAAGTDASKPTASAAGRLYIASDTFKIYRDNGTGWDLIASAAGSGGTITNVTANNGLIGGGSTGSISVGMANVGTVGTYTKVMTDSYGRVTSGGTLVASDIPALPWSQVTGTPTSLAGYNISNGVANAGAAISLQAGAIANLPAAGTAGRIYIGTDNNTISYDTGSSWTTITSGTGFTGSLAGDVTGAQSSTTVAQVGGVTAANVASGANAANAATSANTASKIVSRDASGNFAAGVASLSSAAFRDSSTNTITVKAPTTVTTYSLTLPAAVGAANQVLQTDASGNLSWANQTAPTTVTGTAPISVASNAVSIAQATSSTNGYLSSADWTTFSGKLSSALNSAMIWVGNATNVATPVTPSGDVALSNTGAFTVNGIKGKAVSAAPSTIGQVLRYDGTNITPNFLSMGDLRSTVTGSSALTSSCTASQTMYWSSGTDNLGCQSIGGLNASSVFTSGLVPIAFGGTGAATTSQAYVFIGPTSGSGAPSFRALASTDLPAGTATQWTTSGSNIYYNGGFVGIGTTAPAYALHSYGVGAINGYFDGGSPAQSFYIGNSTSGLTTTVAGIRVNGGSPVLNAASNSVLYFNRDSSNVDVKFENASSDLVTIKANGYVGIGTNVPNTLLGNSAYVTADTAGTSAYASGINWVVAGAGYTQSLNNTATATTANGLDVAIAGTAATNRILNLSANATDVFTVTGAGRVGIGTTAPSNLMQLYSTGTNVGLNISGNATAGNTSGTTIFANMNAGSYNPITQVGDMGLIYAGTTIGNPKGFVIAPWSSSSGGGLRFDASGNIGVGITTPSAHLHLPASSTTAGSAPLKLATGTLLTTAEAGAIEYDGSNLYYTDSSAVRHTINSAAGSSQSFSNDVTMTGSGTGLAVTNNETVGGTLSVAGTTSITNTTASTSTTTGSLVLSGGLGVAGTVNAAIVAAGGGTASAPSHTFTSDLTTGMWLPSVGALAWSTGGSERMRVTSGGYVGIGTTAPATLLETAGVIQAHDSAVGPDNGYNGIIRATRAPAAGQYINLVKGGTSVLSLGALPGSNNVWGFGVGAGTDSAFLPSLLSLNSATGNVGIGTSTSAARFHVMGAASATANFFLTNNDFLNGSAGSGLNLGTGTSSGSTYSLLQAMTSGNTAQGALSLNPSGGNVGIGTTVPEGNIDMPSGFALFGPKTARVVLNSGVPTGERAVEIGYAMDAADTGTIQVEQQSVAYRNLLLQPRGGSVGVGTTIPNAKLNVAGDVATLNSGQLILQGATNSNQQLELAYNTTGDYSYIQSVKQSTAFNNLSLSPSGGNVGIGTTSPTAVLQLKSGTSAPGTSPLKFTSGTLLTTAEAGAVEFDGSNLYYTDSSAVRHVLASSGGTSSQNFSNDVTMTGTGTGLAVTNNETVGGTLAVTGATSITNTMASTSTTTGSLVLSGGLGVAGSVNAAILAAGGGTASAPSHTFTSDLTSGMWLPTASTLAFSSGGVERMRITPAGAVGIGNAAPTESLQVSGNINAASGGNSAGAGGYVSLSAAGPDITFTPMALIKGSLVNAAGTEQQGDMLFETRPYSTSSGQIMTERMRITNAGNVGIGTPTPDQSLEVFGADASNGLHIVNSMSTAARFPVLQIDNYSASYAGTPNLSMRQAAGTMASPAVSGLGTSLGAIVGSGYTGTGFQQASRIDFLTDPSTAWTSSISPSIMTFSTGNTTGLGYFERMRITSNGNVGIGTTAPAAALTVFGNNGTLGSAAYFGASSSGNVVAVGTDAGVSMVQGLTSASAAANLSLNPGGGGVGIGTTSAANRLEVSGGDWYGIQLDNAVNSGIATLKWVANTTYGTGRFLVLSNETPSTAGTGNDGGIMFRVNPSNSPVPAMTIQQSGYVGVGTYAPKTNLDVMGVNAPPATSGTATTAIVRVENNNGNGNVLDIGNYNSGYYGSWLQATERGGMGTNYILALNPNGGNVGVGSASPAYPLDVVGDIRTSTCIRTSAGVTGGTCSSDARLKEDVRPFTLGLEALKGIQPKSFRYNGLGGQPKSEAPELGVIAQDLEKTAPTLVSERLVKMHPEDKEKTSIKVVNYSALLYTVINAVHEIYDDLTANKADLQATKTELEKKGREIASLQANALAKDRELQSFKAENEDMKARLERIEKLLKAK